MPTEACLVTVRSGLAASKGYEDFVAKSLKDDVLQEITSNLSDNLENEALEAFKEAVQEGWSIKDCINKVQNEILPKVPNERNKFYIKLTYDNQLEIEIGVNRFKNGNAQFYHKLGIAPRKTTDVYSTKEDEKLKRKEVLKELTSDEGFLTVGLKKQVTNDKSAPIVPGKVSNPSGGWSDIPEDYGCLPPNPTNLQMAVMCTGWEMHPPCKTRSRSSRRRALSHLYRSNSVGRARSIDRERSDRHRSASPLSTIRPSLDFTTGIIRGKANLKSAGSHTVHRGSFKTGRRFVITKEEATEDIPTDEYKHINIKVENELCPNAFAVNSASGDINENVSNNVTVDTPVQDNLENKKALFDSGGKIKYTMQSKDPGQNNPTSSVIKKELIIVSQDPTLSGTSAKKEDTKASIEMISKDAKQQNKWFIANVETEESYKKRHECVPECKITDAPIRESENDVNVSEDFVLPDPSLFSKRIEPLPPFEELTNWRQNNEEKSESILPASLPKFEISSTIELENFEWEPLIKECFFSKPVRGL